MNYSAEARELVELMKVDELVTDYDVDVVTVLEGRLIHYARSERKARTKVTRTTTDLGKAFRSQDWKAERAQDTVSIQTKIQILEARLARRVRSLCEAAHQLRESQEALELAKTSSINN